jgi:type I restriction enzyme, R subunit
MTEDETRAELIDPKLLLSGWGSTDGTKVYRNHRITEGRIKVGGRRGQILRADYVLAYKGIKLAVIEAKSDELGVGEGVAQAKLYAEKLKLNTTYATNGKEIYSICMKTGVEKLIDRFPTPDELWNHTFVEEQEHSAEAQSWRETFAAVPFEEKSGSMKVRYYQEIAINRVMDAIAHNKQRILLTLATGTGKTAIAFQIAWKLFHSRWNLKRDGSRRPRILFLADRNILADQAYNAFSAFAEDALVRIKPNAIRLKKKVPTNGSVFFTIFQTFMSGTDGEGNPAPYFGEYPSDYFDFIVIDECHRGGANDESNWRGIMEYFSPAVQLGLTATPKRRDNVDTYRYFGEPVFIYSLKEGINDGFLTPFKVKRIKTSLDDYAYTTDDMVMEGEIDPYKLYIERDFNRIIEIKEREAKRVRIFMEDANQQEKSIIFCATQEHAAVIRDLVNQQKNSPQTNYCVRVTANDGEMGEQLLREFQDNEKVVPTILTTSRKLSTGVDARNIRNIVLLRPVNDIIEFKQIIGRGTRLFDGKEFFTIYDFVNAYERFFDDEWDGEPLEPEVCKRCGKTPCECIKGEPKTCPICGKTPCQCIKEQVEACDKCGQYPCVCVKKTKVKLRDGKEREIQHMMTTSFIGNDGTPISIEQFLHSLFGTLPNFFKDENELRRIWGNPITRKTLLKQLDEAGFGLEELATLQKVIDAENSDLFDVLDYVFDSDNKPISRSFRVEAAKPHINDLLSPKQQEFIDFVLNRYIEVGVEELEVDKLPILLESKYQTYEDAKSILGDVADISALFIGFQKHLYQVRVA